MSLENEKVTAWVSSAATGEGQSTSQKINHSITENQPARNDDFSVEVNVEALLDRMSSPNYLHTVSMAELYDTAYQPRAQIVDDLLCAGVYLFVGAPKVGKSFFMAQLGYHVSAGLALWDFPTHKGKVLYLALEDSYAKQKRADRRIDDYYEKIRTGKQEKLFYEVIFQVGNLENMASKSEEGELAANILGEFMKSFQERNPYTNFDFLSTDPQFESFAEAAISAERVLPISLALCATACRTALEFAVKWVYSVDKSLTMPYEDKLLTLISTEDFKDLLPPRYDAQTGLSEAHRQHCRAQFQGCYP